MQKRRLKISLLSAALSASLLLPQAAFAANVPGHASTEAGSALLNSRQISGLAAPKQQITSLSAAAPATGAVISPRLDTKSSTKVKVILQLAGASIAESKYNDQLEGRSLSTAAAASTVTAQQQAVLDAAKKSGLSLSVTYRFNTVLNGMEVELPANQIPLLAKLPGVKSIYENRTYYAIPAAPIAPNAISADCRCDIDPLKQLGVPQAWSKGLTGKGVKVGVIDTGVDYLHPDLKTAYKGGHDSFFNTDDPYEEVPNPATGNAGTSHGTHVSGTIAGRAAGSGDVVQKGVAYESELHVYKVLGFNAETGKSSGSSAQVIDGIERAVKDGMNVINLSLGADGVKDPYSPDSIAVNNAVLSGVVAVVANGNAGDLGHYYYSMGSPASSELAISVAAANSPSSHYTSTVSASVYSPTASNATYGYSLNLMGWRTGQEDFPAIFGTAPLEAVFAGIGAESDYANIDAAGKVVLVSRGSLAFVDKSSIAKAHGAKGIIIFNGLNNADGSANLSPSIPGRDSFIGPVGFFGDSFNYIPTFDMEGAQGRALARLLTQSPGSSFTLSYGADFPRTIDPGDHIASFSSRGPASDGRLSIKPDLAAPGVNILSTWPAYGKANPGASYAEAYNRISGTSMATPHVAGLAALLKQEHPEWTPADVKAALANTSDPIADESGVRYDVYSQGAGRANIANAIRTPAVLQTVEPLTLQDSNLSPLDITNYGDNYSFGVVPAGSGPHEADLRIKNTSGGAVAYAASVELHASVTSDPADPIPTPDISKIGAVLSATSVSAPAGGTGEFSLTLTPGADAAVGVYEGEVVLTASGLPSLRLPFVVHVGDELPDNGFGIQDLTLTNPVISPDGDGVNDTVDASFTLTARGANMIDLELYDVNDDFIGLAFLAQSDDPQGYAPGRYTIQGLDGTYYDSYDAQGNPVYKNLPEGTYTLYAVATEINAANQVVGQYYTTKSIGVAYHKVELGLIANAKESFKAQIVNTTEIGKPVLKLPVRSGVTYAVTGSDRPELISSAGILLARPAANASVSLTVTIAAANVPTLKDTVQAVVALTPAAPLPLGDNALKAVIRSSQTKAKLAAATGNDGLSFTVSDNDLKAVLKGSKPLALAVDGALLSGAPVKLSLSPSQTALLAKAPAGSSLDFNVGSAAVELPLYLLKSVPSSSGIELSIRTAADQSAAFTAGRSGLTLLGSPIAFEVKTVKGSEKKPLAVPDSAFIKHALVLDKGISADKAGALFLYNGKAYPAPSAFTRNSDGTTTAAIVQSGYGVYATAKRPVTYSDISNSKFKASIQSLSEKLLIDGTSDTTFSPKKLLTLSQFDDMLTRAFGLAPLDSSTFSSALSSSSDAASFSPLTPEAKSIASSSGLLDSPKQGLAGKLYNSLPIISREAAADIIFKLLTASKLI